LRHQFLAVLVTILIFVSQIYSASPVVVGTTPSPAINDQASSPLSSIGARNQNVSLQKTVIQPLYAGVSPPLTSIRAEPASTVLEPRETPFLRKPNVTAGSASPMSSYLGTGSFVPGRPSVSSSQEDVQSWQGPAQAVTPIVNFDGLKNSQNSLLYGFAVVPPDTEGDVGPNHYIQSVNLIFGVWSKSGALLAGPLPEHALFASLGSPCGTPAGAGGDPIILYDHLADRWLFTYLSYPSIPGTYYLCTAVSQSGDPLGAWYLYVWTWPGGLFPDYPKYGVWPDGYYLSINQYSNDLSSWAGAAVAVMDRANMLTGGSPTMVIVSFPSSDFCDFSFLPSDLDGPAPTPGTPNYFTELMFPASLCGFDGLDIWRFETNWGTSTFNFVHDVGLTTTSFDWDLYDCSDGWCIPQKGTSNRLDALSDRLMHRLQYRKFGSYQTLVTLHTVDVNGNNHAGIRWYELRNSGGGWSIYQEGTYAPDVAHRWMGSIAMDGSGNTGLCYSVSIGSNATGSFYPSIRCTARLNGDPLGQMTQAEITIMNGGGSQLRQTGCVRSCHRWGDYSMLAVDPSDDHTFWYTQEYYPLSSGPFTPGWSTRIASFTLRSLVTYGLNLESGWNLVSLPLVPLSSSITVILGPLISSNNLVIIWGYTGTPTPTWKFYRIGVGGLLTTIVDGYGYWIFVKFATILQVTGYIVTPGGTPPSYPLVAGWNLVGFKPQPIIQAETVGQYLTSLSTACSGNPCYDANNIWIYDNANDVWIKATLGTTIQLGWAFWMRMTSAAVLYPQ